MSRTVVRNPHRHAAEVDGVVTVAWNDAGSGDTGAGTGSKVRNDDKPGSFSLNSPDVVSQARLLAKEAM
ncbi:hypothetical protein SDC9_172650 [bioreactor metagenome]|uniref:Uncharacterized protein n=1 Tax=bioreactor metagenome TaxID=1076179 RepID=A0A645GNG7_9ZZZZ